MFGDAEEFRTPKPSVTGVMVAHCFSKSIVSVRARCHAQKTGESLDQTVLHCYYETEEEVAFEEISSSNDSFCRVCIDFDVLFDFQCLTAKIFRVDFPL